MLVTWKKNAFALLPTCAIAITTPSPTNYAIVAFASSLLV
jgi:hypothetical protein